MPSLCVLLTYQLSLIYTYRDWDQQQSLRMLQVVTMS